jgi:hypothetical protein
VEQWVTLPPGQISWNAQAARRVAGSGIQARCAAAARAPHCRADQSLRRKLRGDLFLQQLDALLQRAKNAQDQGELFGRLTYLVQVVARDPRRRLPKQAEQRAGLGRQ